MATTKVVIDPLTRIEGHLRVELLAEDSTIKDAYACTTQFRGVENVLVGRDPRDAWVFAQRICGVCTFTHGLCSIAAVEDALAYPIPAQARLIRDLMIRAIIVQDHVIHFYQLQAFDWVNVVSALKADPEKAAAIGTSLSDWSGNAVGTMREVQGTVEKLVNSGQLSIFTNGYWDHPGYALPPEVDLLAVAHYLQALTFQRDMIRLHTIFGGKNPHPNMLVGGMASPINMDNEWTINQVRLSQLQAMVRNTLSFTEQVYYPDVLAILGFYKEWFDIGAANPNFIALGMVGTWGSGDPNLAKGQRLRPGVLADGDLRRVLPFDMTKIAEYVNSAWYDYSVGNEKALPPWEGETKPNYTGPQPPYEWLSDREKYTWDKAPRYDGRAVQTGPIARILLAYAQKEESVVRMLDDAMSRLGITLEQMNSTAGRTLARAMESVLVAREMQAVFEDFTSRIHSGDTVVFNPAKWEPASWPKTTRGVGFVEAPRGLLSHWVHVKDGAITNYQCVVPTTWNASGRDPSGQMGAFEYSLAHGGRHPLLDKSKPLEALRTVHSFDPCMSCAVH
jgi:hydrogenase large subunit